MAERDWKPWMRDLGGAIRRARALAGISQAELATLAGMSQAMISRLEAGRGLSTPLVGVLRVLAAIRPSVMLLSPTEVPEDISLLLDLAKNSAPGPKHDLEPGLATLLVIYRSLRPPERALLARVATATAEALVANRGAAKR